MTHFSETQQAGLQGWKIIKAIAIQGDGVQAPGAVTLCEIPNPGHPFAVHFFNAQDGGFHMGTYCKDRAEAEASYTLRALTYLAD